MPAHKLARRFEFQGLPISVETDKGDYRHWHDPHNDTDGKTKMLYPYGYVRGTLGTDGDAVDVYIGPHKDSTKVFVITQNKAPEFTKIDEQKCMLGFNSAEEAKKAYLKHYDNPKFFHSMKELSMEDFKSKLTANKGKLIKHVLSGILNGSNTVDISKKFRSEAQRKYMFAAADRGEIKRETVEEFAHKTPKDEDLPEHVKKKYEESKDVLKALTAAAMAYTTNRRGERTVRAFNSPQQPRRSPNDVHSERVATPPFQGVPVEFDNDCITCGSITKNVDGKCVRCAHNATIPVQELRWR